MSLNFSVAVWRCGGVAVWRCGGVAVWLSIALIHAPVLVDSGTSRSVHQ
jgi:hypothetical protein